jgi:long-chain fatty acid transport protein
MAGAGRAAMSLDAASQAANPATLAGLAGSTLTVMAMPLALDLDFHGSAASMPASTRDEAGALPAGALYAAWRHGRVTYGLAAYSYLGLSADLGEQWAGRRVIEKSGLATFNLAPAAAVAVTDRLTIGASVAAQRAELDAAVAVANDAIFYGPPAGLPDGQIKLNGDSWELGGQLGLLYHATASTQLGLAWTAPVDHSIPSDIETSGVHPVLAQLLPTDGQVTMDFTVPQQVLLGVAHRTEQGTLVSAGLSWQDWSALGESTLAMPGQVSQMFPDGLSDTWGASIGIRQTVSEHWTLAAGLGYESDPAANGRVPAYFPAAEQWRIAVGAERSVSDTCRLRLELSVVDQGNANVVQTTHPLPLPGIPPLTGTFENARIYLLAVAADFSL